MIYYIICTLLRWFMRFFYHRVYILQPELLPREKPFILVCNHHNSFMDAFVLAIHLNTPLYFIKPVYEKIHPLKRLIMESLHIVPLQRGWHKNGEEQPANPWANLRDLITHNKPLVFFSETEINHLKVSKGAAKIAFHTEEVFDFSLDIEILPVTIHYVKKGEAIIMLGQSIPVSSFEKDYKKFPARTIKYTTNYLEEELVSSSDPEAAEYAKLLMKFQQIARRKSPVESHLAMSAYLSLPISSALSKEEPIALKYRLFHFFKLLREEKLNDWYPPRPSFFAFLFTMLGWPLYLLGFGINRFRYTLSIILSRIFLPKLQHTDSSKMIIGLFLFPMLWLLIIALVGFTFSPLTALYSLVALPLLAQYSFFYWKKANEAVLFLRFSYCLRFRSASARSIEQTYDEVVYLLKKSSPAAVFSA